GFPGGGAARGGGGGRPQRSCRGGERARPGERHQGPRAHDRQDRGGSSRPRPAPRGGRPAGPFLLLRPGSAHRPALEDVTPRRPGGADEHCSRAWNASRIEEEHGMEPTHDDYAAIVSTSERVAWTVD